MLFPGITLVIQTVMAYVFFNLRDVQQQPFLYGLIRTKIVLPNVLILVIQLV
jgi:hypothetical protein